jgi:protein TonB
MSSAVPTGNDRLLMAGVIAAALHALLIFGVSFDAFTRDGRARQVEVTLVQARSQAPRDAEFLAEMDQRGSGREAQREVGGAGVNTTAQPETREPPMLRRGQDVERTVSSVVATLDSPNRIIDRRERDTVDLLEQPAERELARLDQQLARLEASLKAASSPSPRVRRLDAVSARAAVDAAYLAQWRQRVESVGNRYYPEASLRYGIFGSLRLLVTVRSDGELENIEILSGSGQAVLDEAAIRILRLAAPFPPFPEELRATTDKLEIVRTWQFEENPLSSR